MKVDFKFELDQKVKTPLGDTGIVNMVAVDTGNVKVCYIQTATNSQWYKETLLEAAE